jgi:hypothetical protein
MNDSNEIRDTMKKLTGGEMVICREDHFIIIDGGITRTYYMKQYKTSLIIDIYRLVVFLSDDYLEIKSSKFFKTIKSSSFFKIIKNLPSELQIKIIFATINLHQTYISTADFNDGLKEFVKKIENL